MAEHTTQDDDPPAELLEKDKETKKKLVIDTISSFCKDSSPFEIFRNMGEALNDGSGELVVDILTGGLTNYSYKVHMEGKGSMFAKLSFPYALWNPDRNVQYDVKRAQAEYEMMSRYGELAPGCVAKAYFCEAIDDMMLLVTEWSTSDEQWSNQFIDGNVDLRIAGPFARSIAKLHCVAVGSNNDEIDPEYNTTVRPCMLTIFPLMQDTVDGFFKGDVDNRVSELARVLGKETCDAIITKNEDDYSNTRDCLIHSDLHAFNILVEPKPEVSLLEHFGPTGSFAVCDWEMAMVGPIGRDIGLLYTVPIACSVTHAINGHAHISLDMLDYLDVVWEAYANELQTSGEKDEEFIRKAYQNTIAWCGWFLYIAYYTLKCQVAFLPLENSKDVDTLVESAGVIGLQCLQWGYMPTEDLSVVELRAKLRALMEDEIRRTKKPASIRRRRSSMLRASGRRVSDGALHFSSTKSRRESSSSFHLSLNSQQFWNANGIPGEIIE
uniref:Aminoglycoside phosphotransferase domain-containing protein n=1 Tax=Attheya septentrionalis TaxID=420275 RepID=A0A7S2XJV9_9STRA|mmetsp:Transcript_1435/g.2575  ORF Transcript_1435/g.2575 Transcript_1435/m.2575 type:complete len:495 (+) Transcript_1435:361-1845(+)